MMKLLNMQFKDDDTIDLALEIKAIMHDVEATGVKMGIPLIAFVKAIYHTYSHYLESLQSSVQLKDITFDTLLEKFVGWEKYFRRRNTTSQSHEYVVFLAQKDKNQSQYSCRLEETVEKDMEGRTSQAGGKYRQGVKSNLHFICCSRDGRGTST